MAFGLTPSGFVRKKLVEMRNEAYEKLWALKPNIDLSDDSFPAILIQVILLELALLWQALEGVFYSRYVHTARGVALDHLGQRLFLPRRPATKARGTLAVTGEAGTSIPAGTVVRHADGTKFRVTKARVIPDSGITDLPIEAEEVGPGGNKATDSTWRPVASGITILSGPQFDTFNTFPPDTATTWVGVEPSETWVVAQEVETSDLRFPATLDTVRLAIRNPNSKGQFYIRVDIYDEGGALVGGTQTKLLRLEANEELEVTFSGLALDVSDTEKIKLAVIIGEESDGPLEVKANDQAPYGGRLWRGAERDYTTDLWVAIETKVTGATSGGAYAEDDVTYSRRQREAMARAAASIPAAIKSQLMAVQGVRHVKVEYNAGLEADERGIPPKSVRITVAGGELREIGQTLIERGIPAGIATVGSDSISVRDPASGRYVVLNVERPSEVPVYIRVKVTVDPARAPLEDLHSLIKRNIIAYVGGVFDDGTVAIGLGPGENVSIAHIHRAVTSVPGVKTAEVWLSREPFREGWLSTATKSDLPIKTHDPVEIPVTRSDYIEVM